MAEHRVNLAYVGGNNSGICEKFRKVGFVVPRKLLPETTASTGGTVTN